MPKRDHKARTRRAAAPSRAGGEKTDFLDGRAPEPRDLAEEPVPRGVDSLGEGPAAPAAGPNLAAAMAEIKKSADDSIDALVAALRDQNQSTQAGLQKAVEVMEKALDQQAALEARLDQLTSRVDHLRTR